MRRVVVLALLALALPMAAWASGIDLTNQFGTISISTSGISSKGSELTAFNGFSAPKNHSMGSVSYTTGALLTGSIKSGGTFDSAGSSFLVVGNGKYGVPVKGTLFSGSFVGPITWTLVSQVHSKVEYTLSGNISGQLYTGRTVTGTTTQNIYSSVGQLSNGIGHIQLGNSHLNSTPEPGTLGLLGTGLLGIAGTFRRKKA
jgi:hypothetical protein